MSEADFFTRTALGRSLRFFSNYKHLFEVRVFGNNTSGLPVVYNQAISETEHDPRILVFVHDDIYIPDLFWPKRIVDALDIFDIAGVAGNTRRTPRQPSWALIFEGQKIVWDSPENLSGAVSHGRGFPPSQVDIYGQPRQEVKLLDGLMLIARSETLHNHQLRFDPRFDFHFYDLDLCRQAEIKGLKMGTWDISVVHESDGSFGGENWRNSFLTYLEKWQE